MARKTMRHIRPGEVPIDGGPVTVAGELELAGQRSPLSFELAANEDGRLSATATVTQSEWGMKPYSALFGTLKVADDVEVAVETRSQGA